MENVLEKLQKIKEEACSLKNLTPDDANRLKQAEFDLFGDITTIKELCEYYSTDMYIDKVNPMFVNGMYSGVLNGSMFVINAIRQVLSEAEPDKLVDSVKEKLEEIQGLNYD